MKYPPPPLTTPLPPGELSRLRSCDRGVTKVYVNSTACLDQFEYLSSEAYRYKIYPRLEIGLYIMMNVYSLTMNRNRALTKS